MNRPGNPSGVAFGIAIAILCNIVCAFIIANLAPSFIESLAYRFLLIGFIQPIYILPLCAWLYSRRYLETLKGVVFAATMTLLLLGSCFIALAIFTFLFSRAG